MKINSENLWQYINDLATDQKVKFKVYYDDYYKTEILWNGDNFEWDAGTFTSEAFFNPLYDFEVIEENPKHIEELEIKDIYRCDDYQQIYINFKETWNKINEISKAVNYLLDKEK